MATTETLALANPKHLRTADRTYTLGRGPAILHGNGLRFFHFPHRSAFHAVTLHSNLLCFY